MKHVYTPSSNGPWALDRFVPGEPASYDLEADTPFAFPPGEDFPHGGSFFIRVPAGASVLLRTAGGDGGYPLDPGHWPWTFKRAGTHELVASADCTIHVLQNEEA